MRGPATWCYSTADVQREGGFTSLDAATRKVRALGVDVGNPYEFVGLVAFEHRKLLAGAGVDVADMLRSLDILDRLSRGGWPVTRLRYQETTLGKLADRVRRADSGKVRR